MLLLRFFVLGDFNDSSGLTVAYSSSLTGLLRVLLLARWLTSWWLNPVLLWVKIPTLNDQVIRYHFVLVFCKFTRFFIVCFLKLLNPSCTKKTNIKRHMILLRTMWSCSWIEIFWMFYDTVNGNASSINLNKITKTMSGFFL